MTDTKIMAEKYEKGSSLRDIAKHFNCSKCKVRAALKRLGIKPRKSVAQETNQRGLKSGKQAALPYYGFCYFEGQIIKDPREFPILLIIHRGWLRKHSIHQINQNLNQAKILSRKGKVWSWAALQNIVARFENKQLILTNGGKYEFR